MSHPASCRGPRQRSTGTIPPAGILSVQLIDTNYDHSLTGVDQTLKDAEAYIEVILQKRRPHKR